MAGKTFKFDVSVWPGAGRFTAFFALLVLHQLGFWPASWALVMSPIWFVGALCWAVMAFGLAVTFTGQVVLGTINTVRETAETYRGWKQRRRERRLVGW